MSAQFTDDDLEKTVEDANGETIGTVTAVEGDVAQVEPRAGVMDSIRATLGWTRTREAVSVRADAVDEITDEVIHLGTEPLEADEAAGPAADESGPTGDVPDETARGAGLESDEASTRGPEIDRLEGGERRKPDETADPSPETTATEQDLEDELNRGPEVEPPAESEVRDAIDEATETAGGETAEMTDVPEELATSEEHRDTSESDSTAERAEAAERSEPDELGRSGSSGDAESMDVIDESQGDEAFETDEDTDDAEPEYDGDATDTESEVVEDAERETEGMDLADELDRGTDLESVDAESDASERTAERDAADELSRGSDLVSEADRSEGSPERPETEEMDLADELERGVDFDAIEEDAPSATSDRDVGEQPTEEMDLVEELDQGVDVEPAAETDSEKGAAVDADAFPGPQTDTETTSDAAAPRSMESTSHAALGAEPVLDQHTDEPAATNESVTDEANRSRGERGDVESPVRAMLDAQQTAIAQSQQLLEDGLAVQRDVNRIALSALRGQTALQRQGLELFRAVTPDPVEAAESIEPPKPSSEHQSTKSAADRSRSDTGTLQRRRDSPESANRERTFERRLELVDGLDSMYRERLEDADITTLDDLAYADVETVAEAAEVTEERAESWIEQAAA
ncbi:MULTISPECIES: helix-hairpin-helix domain-containing protein [Natrialbaceae]|uniref:helix-hairpin-helix domain-containing protein n=1 Tax=Natrialbaceae TaxID=1644061 RepID=UPI00207C20A2|nr:helix-hairpin-helix domain-containing protein [Natronococcus sp. CG52]